MNTDKKYFLVVHFNDNKNKLLPGVKDSTLYYANKS